MGSTIALEEVDFRGASEIEVKYLLGHSRITTYLPILVVSYIGRFGYGCLGNSDGRYMIAMTRAGISAWQPWGLIHDFRRLSYQWGDALEDVMSVSPDISESPTAILVGPDSEKSVRTLFVGLESDAPLESIGCVFRDLEAAWNYIESKLPPPLPGV